MRILRPLLGAALSLFLSAAAFAAGLASAPERVQSYSAGLGAYRTTAAAGFLSDAAARDFLRTDNPALLAPALQRAHEILDLAALPAQYADPENLRRALIARDSEPSFRKPADIRAFYAGRRLPPSQMRKVVTALAEWRTLDAELRGWLTAAGATETVWAGLSLDERSSAILGALREHVLEGRNLLLDGRAYRARLLEYAVRAAPFMSAHDDYVLGETLDKHAALAADLRRARAAANRAGDSELSEILGIANASGDMDKAREVLDMAEDASSPGARPAKISRRTVAAVAARLPDAIKRWTAGTPAENILDLALGRIELEELPTSLGGYVNRTDRLIVSRENLARFLAERGRPAEDLLTDDALLSEFALEIAPIVVHETTHRLQRLHSDQARMTPTDAAALYGHEDEREAFTVQGLFVRAFAARDPVRAAALAKDDRLAFFWDPVMIRKTIAAIHLGYSNVPSAHGARARASTLAAYRKQDANRRLPAIEAELARRRAMAAGERARANARGADVPELGAGLRGLSERGLEMLRRSAGVAGELETLDRLNAYLDGMAARLKDWTRLERRLN